MFCLVYGLPASRSRIFPGWSSLFLPYTHLHVCVTFGSAPPPPSGAFGSSRLRVISLFSFRGKSSDLQSLINILQPLCVHTVPKFIVSSYSPPQQSFPGIHFTRPCSFCQRDSTSDTYLPYHNKLTPKPAPGEPTMV